VPYEPLRDTNPAEFNRWKDRIGDEGIVLFGFGDAICVPATFFSPEDFSLLWADAPEAFMALIRIANERLCEQAELCCRAGIDAFRLLGGEYASTQLGPRPYLQTVTQPDRAITDIMRAHGALVYYHNHGRTMKYLEMIADIGMHACDCFEAPPWGDCDLRAAKARIGDRICFVGNLDDMEIIDKLPEAEVLAIARERVEEAGRGGFVLGGTASGTYTEQGARGFIAMAKMVREM
jgi:uroporphyrinogen-III decarboxylase